VLTTELLAPVGLKRRATGIAEVLSVAVGLARWLEPAGASTKKPTSCPRKLNDRILPGTKRKPRQGVVDIFRSTAHLCDTK
jgi:hypothetical protein